MDANGKPAGHAVAGSKVTNAKTIVGRAAPSFSTVDAAGKSVSLAGLKSKPTLLVFIQKGCPCCRGGKPYFDRIQNVYGDIANVAGVVVGDAAEAKAWDAAQNPQFRILADPEGKIAAKFKAADGLFTVLISQSGTIDKAYAGYSAPMLAEVTARIAALAGKPNRKMNTSPAPQRLTSGCSLSEK